LKDQTYLKTLGPTFKGPWADGWASV